MKPELPETNLELPRILHAGCIMTNGSGEVSLDSIDIPGARQARDCHQSTKRDKGPGVPTEQ
jgi:hypothetical protein